jgi:hypothetical protein
MFFITYQRGQCNTTNLASLRLEYPNITTAGAKTRWKYITCSVCAATSDPAKSFVCGKQ